MSFLTHHRYVDDMVSGAEDPALRDEQIDQSIQVLAKGGFKFKHKIKSGEEPPKGASGDGDTCKLLGYKWNPKEDYLAPGLRELNFNEKKRGAKAPNEAPIVTREDAKKLLDGVLLTRQSVTARIAEMYHPVGIIKPLKLQLKLQLSKLNGRDWKIPLYPEEQTEWRNLLVQLVDYPNIRISRYIFPPWGWIRRY